MTASIALLGIDLTGLAYLEKPRCPVCVFRAQSNAACDKEWSHIALIAAQRHVLYIFVYENQGPTLRIDHLEVEVCLSNLFDNKPRNLHSHLRVLA
jgi:hypothetical protein